MSNAYCVSLCLSLSLSLSLSMYIRANAHVNPDRQPGDLAAITVTQMQIPVPTISTTRRRETYEHRKTAPTTVEDRRAFMKKNWTMRTSPTRVKATGMIIIIILTHQRPKRCPLDARDKT
nr:hypothetical protein [Pandoravirus aubagnensis]